VEFEISALGEVNALGTTSITPTPQPLKSSTVMSYDLGLDLLPVQQSNDLVSKVLRWCSHRFINNINWFHAVANALRYAAEDPTGGWLQKLSSRSFGAKTLPFNLPTNHP